MEAYKIGNQATDTLVGKAVKVPTTGALTSCLAGALAGLFMNGAAIYRVTAGKTFYITGAVITNISGGWAIGSGLEIRYADDAALTTNPVSVVPLPFMAGALQVPLSLPFIGLSVPASKYLGVWNPTGTSTAGAHISSVFLIGYEA